MWWNVPCSIVEAFDDSYYNKENCIVSGVYEYSVISEEKKTARIVRIHSQEANIVIPETLDGYTITIIGDEEGYGVLSEEINVMGNNKFFLKSLCIPQTVEQIGACAFYNCSNLERVEFPAFKEIWYKNICNYAFARCSSLKNITLHSGSIGEGAFFTNANIERLEYNDDQCSSQSEGDEISGHYSQIKKLVLNDNSAFDLYETGSMDEIYVNDSAKIACLGGWNIYRLYMNSSSAEFVGTPGAGSVLYTIPSQKKAISLFKKERVTYHIKSTDSMKKVTRKKVGKKYKYTWKKVKTTIKKHKYNWDKGCWKKTKKNVATQYQVYGKKKKSDSYQLLKLTKKRKFTTKSKYIKVKPVKIWLE